jgi:hypothetical protein
LGYANHHLTPIRSRQLIPKCAKETVRYPQWSARRYLNMQLLKDTEITNATA